MFTVSANPSHESDGRPVPLVSTELVRAAMRIFVSRSEAWLSTDIDCGSPECADYSLNPRDRLSKGGPPFKTGLPLVPLAKGFYEGRPTCTDRTSLRPLGGHPRLVTDYELGFTPAGLIYVDPRLISSCWSWPRAWASRRARVRGRRRRGRSAGACHMPAAR